MTRTAIGRRIQQRLAEMDQTVAWLAHKLGRSPSTLSRWMDGSRQLSTNELVRIALVLHRTAGWLLDEDEEPQRPPELPDDLARAYMLEEVSQ